MMKFGTSERIGPNRRIIKPEGYLLCENVPVARTGEQLYGPGEIPIAPGPDGVARIERTEEEVFNVESMLSLNGKPVCNNHPDVDVNTENWSYLSKGIVFNVRRGKGEYRDCIVVDLLITDEMAIILIESGKVELSCGYTNDYFKTGEGRGIQRNIRFNHVALVDKGRCGTTCSIKDHAYQGETMTIAEKLRKAFDSNDRAGLEVVIANIPTATRDEAPQGINIHNHGASDDLTARLAKCEAMTQDHATKLSTHDSKFADHEKRIGELEEDEDEGTKDGKTSKDNRRVKDERSEEEKTADAEREEEERKTKDEEARKEEERKTKDAEEEERKKSEDAAIEGELKEEAPEGTGDKAVKSKDSAYLVDSFSETVALAEILSPGIRIPTFDRAAEPKTSYVGICNLRRKSLQLATKDADTMRIIDSVRGRRTVDDASLLKMPCGVVRELFIASAGAKRVANNAAATHDAGHFQNLQGTGGGIGVTSKVKTPAELNRLNAERYGSK